MKRSQQFHRGPKRHGGIIAWYAKYLKPASASTAPPP